MLATAAQRPAALWANAVGGTVPASPICGRSAIVRAARATKSTAAHPALLRTSCRSRVPTSSLWSISGIGSLQLQAAGQHFAPRRRARQCIQAMARKGEDSIDYSQRIVASIAYFLPLLDGLRYGRFLFTQYPVTLNLIRPFAPVIQAYNALPYSSVIVFFLLYLLVVQNQSYSRFVRFNTLQAILLDILLILPSLVERGFQPQGGIGLEILILFYNTCFLFIFVSFGFGAASCLFGKTPRLPIVADAADAQLPF